MVEQLLEKDRLLDKEWREAEALLAVRCREKERWEEDEVQVVVVSVALEMEQ